MPVSSRRLRGKARLRRTGIITRAGGVCQGRKPGWPLRKHLSTAHTCLTFRENKQEGLYLLADSLFFERIPYADWRKNNEKKHPTMLDSAVSDPAGILNRLGADRRNHLLRRPARYCILSCGPRLSAHPITGPGFPAYPDPGSALRGTLPDPPSLHTVLRAVGRQRTGGDG